MTSKEMKLTIKRMTNTAYLEEARASISLSVYDLLGNLVRDYEDYDSDELTGIVSDSIDQLITLLGELKNQIKANIE